MSSYDPNQPYDPNQSGGTPNQPPYGDQPPAYGGTPQQPYGEQPPAYGASTPQQPSYGSQPPSYGEQPPTYGQPPSAYGAPTPPPAYSGQQYAAQPTGTPPANHLVWAIISILLCTPLGIAAIVFSTQVNSKWQAGDYAGAEDASRKARMFALIGTILGAVGIVLYIVFIIIGVMASSSGYSSY